jgi:iron-sulfur cluster assembly protein
MAIEISDRAVDAIKNLLEKEGIDAGGLRVGIKGGGCSGLSYNLGFDTEARKGDKVFAREDVKLFCDLKSYIYLNNTVLDFDSGLMGKGFQFLNPNAKNTCGCGESFSV